MVGIDIGVAPATTVAVDPIPVEAWEVLYSLAETWGDDVVDSQAMEVVPMKGAMTNEVFQVAWKTIPINSGLQRKVFVRIYGEGVGLFFVREDEEQTFEAVSMHGHGPRLLGRFPNGRIEEFIHARTLSAKDLRDPEISGMIASKLRVFHGLDMPGPKTVQLWDRLRNWLKVAKKLSSLEEAKELCLDLIEKEISSLENDLSREEQMIGFCHNDLQYGNIMMDEETKLVTIIDYEYASFNPIAYDIANHFCEMAANYDTDTPHMLYFNKYPDIDERKRFVKLYLSSSGEYPEQLEVDNLVQDIENYALASHLIWGLWGIVSDHVNDIDFNYMDYAKQRFQQYWLRKSEPMGCTQF